MIALEVYIIYIGGAYPGGKKHTPQAPPFGGWRHYRRLAYVCRCLAGHPNPVPGPEGVLPRRFWNMQGAGRKRARRTPSGNNVAESQTCGENRVSLVR